MSTFSCSVLFAKLSTLCSCVVHVAVGWTKSAILGWRLAIGARGVNSFTMNDHEVHNFRMRISLFFRFLPSWWLFFSYQREEGKHHLPLQHRKKTENTDEKNIKNYTVNNFQKVPKSTRCQVHKYPCKYSFDLKNLLFELWNIWSGKTRTLHNIKILMYGSKHLNHEVQDKTLLDTEKVP